MLHVSEELERGHIEHRPYWKRAHHDWRFWFALGLMLVAMFIYLLTDNLSIVPHIHTRAALSSNLGGSAAQGRRLAGGSAFRPASGRALMREVEGLL